MSTKSYYRDEAREKLKEDLKDAPNGTVHELPLASGGAMRGEKMPVEKSGAVDLLSFGLSSVFSSSERVKITQK